jgi:hypothetical protein
MNIFQEVIDSLLTIDKTLAEKCRVRFFTEGCGWVRVFGDVACEEDFFYIEVSDCIKLLATGDSSGLCSHASFNLELELEDYTSKDDHTYKSDEEDVNAFSELTWTMVPTHPPHLKLILPKDESTG